ncbi:S-adenosyl-L-methionine-dependent methyltransferase [Trametes coccinea BRFM310]|uniref:S-adenosyl-L-methionine-dependent methyltransferase n=1 Tax=Trametes coccinea (strain BRFM310) TaxID=1353009 RepID=A0A1Y2I8L2_TRAC3|nr:S-adenosyl-L-methionine-dependent methyltransferase [Trametes coccinea BRFM310]
MSFSALRALHASIGKAIDDLESIYKDRSQSKPLDFPSLNDPYYASAEHSELEELAHKLNDEPAVSLASKKIVAACGQLSATVNKPWYGLMEAIQAGQLSACIRFLEAAHIVEILREAGPQGLHVRDIQRSVIELRPENARPDPATFTAARLGHVLRLLATSHWLREVAPDVFANNRRSSYIDSGKTVEQLRAQPDKKYLETDGVAAFVGLTGDEAFKFMAYMTEWFLPDTRTGSLIVDAKGGFDSAKGEASASEKKEVVKYVAPFNLAFDTQLGFFPWLELPENRSRLERFGHAMTGTRQWETKEGILFGFPWADLQPDSVLIDVGGGIGSTSLTVALAHPHIKVVVEDRPQVVELAPSSWGPKFAPIFESGRMSFRVRDLFAPFQPLAAGKAPDVFLIRLVLHDWMDDDCRKMLRILRDAASPNTKLLIGDMLLPFACDSEDAFIREDSPILPNLGVANIHGYLIDVMMMGMFGAKERTVAEMTELTLSAGWKITDIRRSSGSLWAYTTAVPV